MAQAQEHIKMALDQMDVEVYVECGWGLGAGQVLDWANWEGIQESVVVAAKVGEVGS